MLQFTNSPKKEGLTISKSSTKPFSQSNRGDFILKYNDYFNQLFATQWKKMGLVMLLRVVTT